LPRFWYQSYRRKPQHHADFRVGLVKPVDEGLLFIEVFGIIPGRKPNLVLFSTGASANYHAESGNYHTKGGRSQGKTLFFLHSVPPN
jgi:hypothetical protein